MSFKLLVACEFSGVVRDAFRRRGVDAVSCDLLECSGSRSHHIVGDVLALRDMGWDMVIAHPPCTYLTVAGNRHYAHRPDLYLAAAEFARQFEDWAEYVAIENPVGRLSSLWRKPDQYIQPWQFGHPVTKKTGLWLKNLPCLEPTEIVETGEYITFSSGKRMAKWYSDAKSSKDYATIRSVTFEGIAEAMADQWTQHLRRN